MASNAAVAAPRSLTAGDEWRRSWTLPPAAALGYATCVIHIYGLGVFIDPIAREFGWSRAEVTVGLTLSTLIQAVMAIPIGIAVDRFGARLLALLGIPLTCLAFANLGRASGSDSNWYLSWIVMSLASLPIQATVWTRTVTARFTVSRGLALGVTLCGASVALIVFPWLGAWLIADYGWREAMRLEAIVWAAVALPVTFVFFRGGKPVGEGPHDLIEAEAEAVPGVPLGEGLRSTVFARLLLAALLFTFAVVGFNVHFPLMLKAQGHAPVAAAGVATLIGWSSIIGRLGTGLMLDRFRAARVGAAAFALPALACALLLLWPGSWLMAGLAALLIGLTLGAEIDVMVFLTSRYFGLRHFGALYGGILSALSIGTAFGPLAAARVFDTTGSYDAFIGFTVVAMIVSSAALASLPPPPPPHGIVESDA